MDLVLLGGAPGVGKSAVGRELLACSTSGVRLLQWVDVDNLWQHQPWRVDESMRTMVQANLRAVLENARTADVDVMVVTWVFQSSGMHDLVVGLAPPGTSVRTIQLHADRDVWRHRWDADPSRPDVDDFFLARYADAQTTPVDHVVDTGGRSARDVAERITHLLGL